MLPHNVEFVDLSQTIENGIPLAGILPRLAVWQCLSLRTGDSVNCQAELMSDHTGTRCDAPRHVFNSGKPVDMYPAEAWSGLAVCLGLEEYDGKAITASAIQEAEGRAVRPLREGDIALLCTGHSRQWAQIPEGYAYLQGRPWLEPSARIPLAAQGISYMKCCCPAIY